MWLFTGGKHSEQPSFMSAVQHNEDPNMLVVRTRDEVSATQLATATGGQVVQKDFSDYPFRVFVTKAQMKAYVCELIDDLDYGNFKDHVHTYRQAQNPRWNTALHAVWAAMCGIAPRKPYSAIDGKPRRSYYTAPRDEDLSPGSYADLQQWLRDRSPKAAWDGDVLVPERVEDDEDSQLLADLRDEETRLLRKRDAGELDYDDVHEALLLLEESRRSFTERRRGFDPAQA